MPTGRVARFIRGLWETRGRGALIAVALLAATYFYARILDPHYPVRRWLFWSYAGYWLAALFWMSAVLCGGYAAFRLLRLATPAREAIVLSFALGVYVFVTGLFVAGIFGLLGPVFWFVWPFLMLLTGVKPIYELIKRDGARFRKWFQTRRVPPWSYPVLAFGLIGIGMVYFAILTPENASYDARWYHLPIAERYAITGQITRFPEGWMAGTTPHLASLIYTWAFLVPKSNIFHRVEIAAHLEFVLFLWTLAAVPSLVRRLVPRASGRLAWVVVFLFPGLFLYDSSLGTAADHVAAFWAIPLFLTFLRAWPALEPRRCALFAVMAAGALLTKYQSAMLVAFPAVALIFRAATLPWLAFLEKRRLQAATVDRPGPRSAALGLGVAAAGGLLLTTPHWLKNWLWHGDPLYPILYRHLNVHPWTTDAAYQFEKLKESGLWRAKGTGLERLESLLKTLWSFSFEPHDWPEFHGAVPVFGSLFTLTIVALPFLRGVRRVWVLVIAAHVGVAVWWATSHQDRYLQAIVPWMAATTAATLVVVWRSHPFARFGLIPLVGLQMVWGGDVYFIPTHGVMGQTPTKAVIDLLSTGYKKNYQERFRPFGDFYAIGRTMPKGANVLIHRSTGMSAFVPLRSRMRCRSSTASTTDASNLRAPCTTCSTGWESLTSSGRRAPARCGTASRAISSFTTLSRTTPSSGSSSAVSRRRGCPRFLLRHSSTTGSAYFGCDISYTSGLYQLRDLTVPAGSQPKHMYGAPRVPEGTGNTNDPEALIEQAGFVVFEACHTPLPPIDSVFEHAVSRNTAELWIRKTERDSDGHRALHTDDNL